MHFISSKLLEANKPNSRLDWGLIKRASHTATLSWRTEGKQAFPSWQFWQVVKCKNGQKSVSFSYTFSFQHLIVGLYNLNPHLMAVLCNLWSSAVVQECRHAQEGQGQAFWCTWDGRVGKWKWSQHLIHPLINKTKFSCPNENHSWPDKKAEWDCSFYQFKYKLPCDRCEFAEDNSCFMWHRCSWHLTVECSPGLRPD